MTRLTADAVCVTYGSRRALDGAGLNVEPGEVVGLIGPNGAGKTTLLRACANLIAPRSGAVLFEGVPLPQWSRRALAQAVSFLPHGAPCHWPLEVTRLVALGRWPHLPPWSRPRQRDDDAVREALARADVLHLGTRTADQLSDGERARVMLARALASEPRLLLADEPVAGLDPHHQLSVMAMLRDLAREGRSVVVTLHDLSLAARFCHRLVLLRDGRTVAEGIPDSVLSTDRLESTFRIRAVRGRHEDASFLVPWEPIHGKPTDDNAT